jgi:multiple sugar transport system substrate-binding protein
MVMDDTRTADDAARRLSRRAFLRGASAGAGALLLAACGAPAAAPAPTTAPAGEATAAPGATVEPPATPAPAPDAEPTPAGFATAGDNGTLNVVYWADSNDSFKTIVERFTADTGIGINYEVAPADYLTWQQLMTTRLSSGDTTVDAFHGDDFQSAIYGAAGWLADLGPIVQANNIDLSDWPTSLVTDVSSWDGKLYRLPWGADTELFFYRTDFFEAAGVEPPTTWDELVEVGKALTKDGVWGIGLAGQKNGVLGNDVQHWTNQAGGAINRLDDPGSKQALQFYKDLYTVHKIAPADTPQQDYTTILNSFLDNKIAMWWCWDGFLGAMRTNPDFWKDQVSAFLPPTGPQNAQTTTGAWGWSINAYSEQQDLAAQWVAYINQPEIMKLQILRGRVPARKSLWSDPEVQDQVPSTPFLADLAGGGDLMKARPVTPSIQEIYDAAEQNIHAFLTEQVDLDTAVGNAMEKIGPILERDMRG